MSPKTSACGTLLGLACGDALGRPVEFTSPKQIQKRHGTVTEMLGYGTHGQPAGTITDDTEMALCVARSLVEKQAFDGEDVAERFLQWYQNDPFDIGLMTADALRQIETGKPWDEAGQAVWEDRPEGQNAGNGSVMRCAPHAIAFSETPDKLHSVSVESSQITHADPRCTYGCAVLNLTLAGFLREDETPLATALRRVQDDAPEELLEALNPVAEGKELESPENTGYVVHSLQTALHDAFTASNPEEAIVTAVNRGGDTDTIGAIAGAVAGAKFGVEGLPERWLNALNERQEIDRLATELWDLTSV